MNKHPSFLPVASALRGSMKQYDASMFRHDLLAAFVVSLVALPLSMALSIAVGLPPQHGLYTAIVAGIIVPLLGGSIWQVSGPTAAFVVILAPIVSQHGLRGIVWSGLIAGVILIGMGLSRLGRLINYVPYPVTTGFTAGIAVVLAVLSLNDFMGLGIASLDGSFVHKLSMIAAHFSALQPATLTVGVVTLALLFWGERIVPFMPAAMTAILVGTGLALALTLMGYEVATIGSQFSYTGVNGVMESGIPPYPPVFSWPTFSPGELLTIPTFTEFHDLLFPAVAIAILAAIESLLSATVADSMAGTKHDPNAELTGIGVGNIFSALAAGIPATGAIARTATMINNGARSPLASSIHAVLIMVYVLILAPYISYVPMAALAALLIHTAYRMSHYKQFIRTIQIAPGSDVVVLLVCFVLTVFIDMVAGVGIGMVCASLLLIKRVMEMTQVEVEGDTNELVISVPGNAPQFPKGTIVYRVRGPLFFGTIEKAFERYQFTHDYVKRFILDIRGVPFIDMTGLVAVKTMLSSIAREERPVHIICNSPEIQKKIQQKISDHHVKQFVHFHEDIEQFRNFEEPDIKESNETNAT